MYQQSGPMPQGVSPNAMMGARGPPSQGFSPMRHGAGPMVSSQTTPGKRPADNRNPPPMGKGYVDGNLGTYRIYHPPHEFILFFNGA